MADPGSLPLIPAAPFAADGGEGGYRKHAHLNIDIDIARRALGAERWPIGPERRSEIVEWLMFIVNACDDSRTKVNAAKAILVADKLNLEETRLAIQATVAHAKLEKENKPETPPQVTVNVSGNVNVTNSFFDRIADLEGAFAGAADRAGEGDLPSDGFGKPVDP